MTNPMKIGITSFATQGGSGIVATELGLALAQSSDYEIHFISNSVPMRLRSFAPNIFFHEVEVNNYPSFPHAPYSLALASKMMEVARYHGLDILHVHYAIPHAASAYLAKQMLAPEQIKTITTLHGTDITLVGREPNFYPMTRFMINASDAVTAVSDFLRRETLEIFQVSKDVQVISNFVDTSLFRPREDLRKNNPISPTGVPILMHASNFRKVKNVPAVVRSFAEVRSEMACKLVFVGDGPERGPAEELGRELGVAEDMLFLGNQESMEELMAMADILLLPSEHESFGLVALEAMSCGTAVVTSNRGGLGELVSDGKTGFLLEPEDTHGQAQAALRILKDKALSAKMGALARATAVEKYCINCVIHDYKKLYHRLLEPVA